MKNRSYLALAGLAAFLSGCADDAIPEHSLRSYSDEVSVGPIPDGQMTYHGGPVMLGTTHVYYIWYGNWAGNTANLILTNLAQNIGGSPYFNINTTKPMYDAAHSNLPQDVKGGIRIFDAQHGEGQQLFFSTSRGRSRRAPRLGRTSSSASASCSADRRITRNGVGISRSAGLPSTRSSALT